MIYKFPEDFEQINQGEYRKLKRDDSKKANGYTARIGFKFYKVKKDVGYLDLTK
jgi:hypothetical protein